MLRQSAIGSYLKDLWADVMNMNGERTENNFEEMQPISALLWIDSAPRAWIETIISLLRNQSIQNIYVGFSGNFTSWRKEIQIVDEKLIFIEQSNCVMACNEFITLSSAALLLFISAPVRMPESAFEPGIRWMSDDARIATLSFLSNAAGSISIPHRNTATPFCVDGHDETTLTQVLRKRMPGSSRPCPLAVAEGPIVLVNRSVIDVCGEFSDGGTGNLQAVIADISLGGVRRGFNSFLDPYTYILMQYDGYGEFKNLLEAPGEIDFLKLRYSFFPALYQDERQRSNSVLGDVLDSVRAQAMGLRILIDGSELGPKEMGTQMLIVNLSKALARCSEVQFVAVGVPDPSSIPAYAQELRNLNKIRFVPSGNLDFPGCPQVDIIHRPFQPNRPIPWERWREISKRSLVTIQDLIAFRNGSYFGSWDSWINYRRNLNYQVSQCDGIVSISYDVIHSILEERLSIERERIYVVENGADARSKDEPAAVPDALLERGWASVPFLFVLGATYAHKNRDYAIRVWNELRLQGFNHKLILVGASPPYGSTRIEEALLCNSEFSSDILNLPEVASEERNWLLSSSDLVMYLTSAEGFGQVPFEAARFGVPTLFVSFGPLRELIQDLTRPPETYDLASLVRRAVALLNDKSVAQESVRSILSSVEKLRWADTARKSIDVYYELLRSTSRHFL